MVNLSASEKNKIKTSAIIVELMGKKIVVKKFSSNQFRKYFFLQGLTNFQIIYKAYKNCKYNISLKIKMKLSHVILNIHKKNLHIRF